MKKSEMMNTEKAYQCCLLLKDYFAMKTDNLAYVAYPATIPYGSSSWLVYIFYSCLLDYGMRSRLYHQNLVTTYEKFPQLFDPKYIVANGHKEKELMAIMKNNIHPRYPNVAWKKWVTLSKELARYDDLLDKVKEFQSFYDLSTFIKNLNGYGQKTGGLLLRLIVDSSICTFKEEIDFIPLDRHDLEISYLCDVISMPRLSSLEIKRLSDIWISSAKKVGISPSAIDKYLWEIGNQFCNRKDCVSCPLCSLCKTKKSS